MQFTSLNDLVHEVQAYVSNVSENQVLQALRRSARKFMNNGKLNQEILEISLISGILKYNLDLPTDVFVKEIIDQSSSYTFNNDKTIIFETVDINKTISIEVILGYNVNANNYPTWIINRYNEGIVAGACGVLSPSELRHYNKIFFEELADAMKYMGVFTGVQG